MNFRFLTCVRVSTANSRTYVKSFCRAEMRKPVLYEVDIVVTCCNVSSVVVETQCECAAGLGPVAHCKHVCAVLCGMLDFVTNHSVTTEDSCTAQLQTFNKPAKRHTGAPVVAESLQLGKRASGLVFDPRPKKERGCEGYDSYLSNLTVNYMFSPKILFVRLFYLLICML